MSISQVIYTQYRPFHHTIYPPICITCQFTKLNVPQIYCIDGMHKNATN